MAADYFSKILTTGAPDGEIIQFLKSITLRDWFSSLVPVIRQHSLSVNAPRETVDVCGTGGSFLNLINISTATAFLCAAGGIPVAKHGNRAVTSSCGSSDVLEVMGVNLDISPSLAEKALREVGIAYLHAPNFHPKLHALFRIRKLGVEYRALIPFNSIMPLCNPVTLDYQVIGISRRGNDIDIALYRKYLECLKGGTIVLGASGLDELTTWGVNYIFRYGINGHYYPSTRHTGIRDGSAIIEKLKGTDRYYNADMLFNFFSGKNCIPEFENIVFKNAALVFETAKREIPDFRSLVSKGTVQKLFFDYRTLTAKG